MLENGGLLGIVDDRTMRWYRSDRVFIGCDDNVGMCHIISHGGALIGLRELVVDASVISRYVPDITLLREIFYRSSISHRYR